MTSISNQAVGSGRAQLRPRITEDNLLFTAVFPVLMGEIFVSVSQLFGSSFLAKDSLGPSYGFARARAGHLGYAASPQIQLGYGVRVTFFGF